MSSLSLYFCAFVLLLVVNVSDADIVVVTDCVSVCAVYVVEDAVAVAVERWTFLVLPIRCMK